MQQIVITVISRVTIINSWQYHMQEIFNPFPFYTPSVLSLEEILVKVITNL